MSSSPFVRGPFEALPEQPRKPHPYFSARGETLAMRSRPFGTMAAHVRVYGSGPPLLLVHGLMTSSYSWRYVLEPLGARFTLYMPDLPGNGRSEAPPDAHYTPDALAEWLGEVQQELGVR